jgi:4-amino-4-deoxy-L-arabinose transferase-like glycosyltransferase
MTAMLSGYLITAFGPHVAMVKALWICLSALTIFPVAWLAWCLFPRPWVSVLAAAAFSIYPFSVYYSTLLLSETPFALFTCALVALLIRASVLFTDSDQPKDSRSGLKLACAVGTCMALAHLTRPTLMYFIPLACLWLVLVARWPARHALLALVIVGLLVTPWVVRNYQAFDAFIPGSLGLGQTLLEGNNRFNLDGGVLSPNAGYFADLPRGLNEYEVDEWKKATAISFIRSEPERFLVFSVRKAWRLWNVVPNALGYDSGYYRWLSLLSVVPVFIFAALYPLVVWASWRQWGLLLVLVGYYTALHMVTLGSIRYRFPLEPILVATALASVGHLVERSGIWGRWRARR